MLGLWARSMLKYHDIGVQVRPMRGQLRSIQDQYSSHSKALKQAKASLVAGRALGPGFFPPSPTEPAARSE